MRAGVPQGPLVGQVLGEVEEWWIDGDFAGDEVSLAERLEGGGAGDGALMSFELLDSLSLPADPAKANEDAFAVEKNDAVVLDGATGLGEMLMPGPSDAAWIAHFGARRLMAHRRDGDSPQDALRHALADAEKSFTGLRRRPPKEKYEIPFASMMFVSAGENDFEALWFGDCAALALRPGEGVEIVGEAFDKRAAEARRVKLLAEAKGLAPAAGLSRAEYLPHLRASRNKVNTRAGRLVVLARSARRRSCRLAARRSKGGHAGSAGDGRVPGAGQRLRRL